MIEILKNYMTNRLNNEINEYNNSLSRLKEMEEKIINDNSEQEYQEKLKSLKGEYGLKKIFNSRLKKEYNDNLNAINENYNNNLREFKIFYDEYETLKVMLSKWDIYRMRKQLDAIPKYKKLKDFNLTYDEVIVILKDNGIYDKLTKEEMTELGKLPKKKK